MVLTFSQPELNPETLVVYYTFDAALSDAPVVILYGSASQSTRVQCHVATPVGVQQFARLAVSPSSPLYAAVTRLPNEDQGDEVCRALSYALFKYFSELSEEVKQAWVQAAVLPTKHSAPLELFSETHAASLASRMTQAKESKPIVNALRSAYASESVSYLDADIILPQGSFQQAPERGYLSPGRGDGHCSRNAITDRYGDYAALLDCFGEPAFIPTSKVHRAPSRANASNRSISFSKSQKETVRRELCEFIDTEESYVEKLDELVNDLAAKCRPKVRSKAAPFLSPSDKALASLFPTSLDVILSQNSAFLSAFRKALEDSEGQAIADIESTLECHPWQPNQDATGLEQISTCLLEWLPKFKGSYKDYIKSQAETGPLFSIVTNDKSSMLALRFHSIGEQKIKSMLIEPVQRISRYSLYIENILRQLPAKHPALQSLLRAKDLVADICAQDVAPDSSSKMSARLQQLVSTWPSAFQPHCRILSAFDAVECRAPYHDPKHSHGSEPLIGLLFVDYLAFLRKPSYSTGWTARGLMAEIESATNSNSTRANNQPQQADELVFYGFSSLQDLDVVEFAGERAIKTCLKHSRPSTISMRNSKSSAPLSDGVRVFFLGTPYEGRASRLTKDISKARIESRFSERERESGKWEARDTEDVNTGLGLFSAVFEHDPKKHNSGSDFRSGVSIVIDPDKSPSLMKQLDNRSRPLVSIMSEGDGFYRLQVESSSERKTTDLVTSAEFVHVLMKRISSSISMQRQTGGTITNYLIQHYTAILKSLELPPERRTRGHSRTKNIRDHSPVKTLSRLFGGFSPKDSGDQKTAPPTPSVFGDSSWFRPAVQKAHPEQSSEAGPKVMLLSEKAEQASGYSVESLEHTLAAFTLALHARKGNIVGRSVSNRRFADETAVNDLHNALIEQPSNHEMAAQASVDVLFAGFEKFMKTAWSEKLGPIFTSDMLEDLQKKSNDLSPIDFEEFLLQTVSEMAPQNQRAFRAILNLLIDLLGGTGNDGDRGALMAAMTEITIADNYALNHMSLFDRLVEDNEVILRNQSLTGSTTPGYGSVASSTAARSTQTGSVSSKASSWSKRLGWGSLHRENSKTDSVSKVGSVLRTWSKTSKPAEPQPRLTPVRTQSIDSRAHLSPFTRPTSKDQISSPPSAENSRPCTGQSWDRSAALKEASMTGTPASERRKRRSSLSDLPQLPLPNTSPFWAPPTHRRPEPSPLAHRHSAVLLNDSSQPSSPTGLSRANAIHRQESHSKENVPPQSEANETSPSRPMSSGSASQIQGPRQPSVLFPAPLRVRGSPSAIPVPRGVLSERPNSGNTPPPPSPTKSRVPEPSPSPKKLRVQNSQKIRERLHNQHEDITSAESSLQVELAKIGEELSALNVSSSPTKDSRNNSATAMPPPQMRSLQRSDSKSQNPGQRAQDHNAQVVQNLNTRLRALDTRVKHLVGNLSRHNSELENVMLSSLKVAEKKAKELDVRLREANQENEELYSRNNEELGRLFELVGKGDDQGDVSELKRKFEESLAANAAAQREVAKLRRENAGLKAKVTAAVE